MKVLLFHRCVLCSPPCILAISSSQQQWTNFQEIKPIRGSSLLVRPLSGGRPGSYVVFSPNQWNGCGRYRCLKPWVDARVSVSVRVVHLRAGGDQSNPAHKQAMTCMRTWKHTWYNFKKTLRSRYEKERNRPPIIHPSPAPLLPPSSHPTPPLPRETLSTGSDGSPPLMLACMNVKSLQASSAHPRWETLQEESSMSEPILACLPRTVLPFFSLFSSCPPLLCSPEVLPLTDPTYVRGRKRENTNVGFRREKKRTAAAALKCIVSQLPVAQPVFLTLLFVLLLILYRPRAFSSVLSPRAWHCGIKMCVLLPSLCFSYTDETFFKAATLTLAAGARTSQQKTVIPLWWWRTFGYCIVWR